MRLKNLDVDTADVSREIWYACGVFDVIIQFQLIDVDAVVTAMRNGSHKEGSLHYSGKAVDIRSHGLGTPADREAILYRCKSFLSPQGFDVLLEGKNTPNEHFHIEYDPKSDRKFL